MTAVLLRVQIIIIYTLNLIQPYIPECNCLAQIYLPWKPIEQIGFIEIRFLLYI